MRQGKVRMSGLGSSLSFLMLHPRIRKSELAPHEETHPSDKIHHPPRDPKRPLDALPLPRTGRRLDAGIPPGVEPVHEDGFFLGYEAACECRGGTG
jgi:hypothetical protein